MQSPVSGKYLKKCIIIFLNNNHYVAYLDWGLDIKIRLMIFSRTAAHTECLLSLFVVCFLASKEAFGP